MARISLKDGSGFLEIDHRDSPGLRPEDVAHLPGAVAVQGGEHYERDIQQCTHCQRGVVLNPLRERPRGYCPKCNHYICDGCEAIRSKTNECVPMSKVFDKLQEHDFDYAGRQDNPESQITLDELRTDQPKIVVPQTFNPSK